MRRRKCHLPDCRVFVTALLFIAFWANVEPVSAETHYSNPHRNCRIEAAVSLPLNLTKTEKSRAAWTGWHLKIGGNLISVKGGDLASHNPVTDAEVILMSGLGPDYRVHAGVGPSGIYTAIAPHLGRATTAPFTLSGYAQDTHTLLWSVQPFADKPAPTFTIPVASEQEVFVGAANQISVRSAENGKELWTQNLNAIVGENAAFSSRTVVLPATNGIIALDVSDGKTLWHHQMSPANFNPSRPLTIDGGKVYVPLGERNITAFELETGKVLWESAALPNPIDFRHPVILDATGVFVPTYGGLTHLSVTGSLLWSKSYPFLKMRNINPAVLLTADAIFVGGADGLYALSPETGEILWDKDGLGQIADIEYFAPGLVVVNSQGTAYSFAP